VNAPTGPASHPRRCCGRRRPATEADRAQGVTTPDLDWADLRDYRDYLVRHLDDPAQVTGYQDQGVTASD